MNHARMRRLTGAVALASVVLWFGIFPLYVVQARPITALPPVPSRATPKPF